MKIAYVQMKIAAGHPDLNTKKILHFIDEARAQGADVVIFPEYAVPGSCIGAAWNQAAFLRECFDCGEKIIAASKGIVVLFGNIDTSGASFYFTAQNGEMGDATIFSRDLEFEHGNKVYSVGCLYDDEDFDDELDFYIKIFPKAFSIDKNIADKKISAKCPMFLLNMVGIQNTGKTVYAFEGGSAVFNSRGEIVQRTEPFVECMNCIELEEIDRMPALAPETVDEAEKIYRALNYGVKNFLEQIGMKKVVVGVSGGIDSAVAAALYVDVLGAENVVLVNMPSRFNSATTKNLSEQLAKNLGCQYFVVPIQESVDWTVKQLEGVGLSVSSFVRENIQARDRSSRILAAVAATYGGGFTCNANKAESTVGYATLYGDEAGFLSALADLWKFQVYALAHHLNEKIFRREVIPQGIIDIVPSAELSTAQNVDEGKGDPLKYPYHDYLLRAFVERNLTPEDILTLYNDGTLEENIGCERGLVKKFFPTAQEFIDDLERWWKQFTGMGVAKRIQSPPIFAVTDKPFGARRESQNGWHFTQGYLALKNKLLA